MNRIASRAWVTWFLIAVLLGGTGLFVYEYATEGQEWVSSAGSPHLYDAQGKARATIVDRNGVFLLERGDTVTYADDAQLRRAMLHWVGDREGNIQTSALSYYAQYLAQFDPVNGLYTYGGSEGQIELTLSSTLQIAALEAMGEYVGTLAVYNYKTGQLLCAVSTPTFDPEQVPDLSDDPTGAYDGVYLNRFLQSSYIPGSIFKIVTTAAALQEVEGIQDMTFTCTGEVQFGVDRVTCERVHGKQTIKEAMAVSCNCVYAQIAMLVGAEKLQSCAAQLGVCDRVTFDGITTAAGNCSFVGEADVNVGWSAIGQHLDQINPCSFLTLVGMIANDGVSITPHVVESVRVGDTLTYRAEPSDGTRILSHEVAQQLRELMRNNVVSYYGVEQFPDLCICGKTGTGQMDNGNKPNAMFTGFVDDESLPLAFIVCIENGGYGRKVAIPVIARVLEACLALKNEL